MRILFKNNEILEINFGDPVRGIINSENQRPTNIEIDMYELIENPIVLEDRNCWLQLKQLLSANHGKIIITTKLSE